MSDSGSTYTCINHTDLRWFDTKPGGKLVFAGAIPTPECPTGRPDMAGGMPPMRTLKARMEGYNPFAKELKEEPSITTFADVAKFVDYVRKVEKVWAFECECPASDLTKLPDEDANEWLSTIRLADEAEKMYLVCGNCGEAFDSLDPAVVHEGRPSGIDGLLVCDDVDYTIKPESEAM